MYAYIVRGGAAGFTHPKTSEFFTFDEMIRRGYSPQELVAVPLGNHLTVRRDKDIPQ